MPTTLFSSLTEQDKTDAVKRLIEESTPRDDYFLMILLSITMAAFGLLMNSEAIVIGSMLIAPLLSPILSISLGIVMADSKLIYRSVFTLIKSLAWAIPAAAIVTLLFSSQAELGNGLNEAILSRTEPSILYIAVAVISGLAASFALIKPQLSAKLPGVAISVAIIPPIAVTGIGLARLDWVMMSDSFILFVLNVISIVFASMIVFSLMNLFLKRPVAERALEKEDNQLKKEKQEAEDIVEKKKKEKEKNQILKEADKKLENNNK